MPGAVRPYTLTDIIGQLNEQSTAQQGSIVPLQGFFAQPSENTNVAGSFTTVVQANANWDSGQWGFFTWS